MGQAARPISVLLVEDDALISSLVCDWLIEGGFDVHEVPTADEALALLDAGEPVDVLFTDINLPGSMDGAELAARARALRPDLPVVYASGRMRPEDFGPLVPRAMFLPKPYSAEAIRAVLARLTDAGARPH
jgi:CheY-like chemotaxis protein